jgi:hypothetical protein
MLYKRFVFYSEEEDEMKACKVKRGSGATDSMTSGTPIYLKAIIWNPYFSTSSSDQNFISLVLIT